MGGDRRRRCRRGRGIRRACSTRFGARLRVRFALAGGSASAAAIGVGAAIWIVVIQWLSSAFGGYLTGRLRTKWAAMGTDEVFFRDTAHGFLAWALATIFVVGFAASVAGGGVERRSTSVASGAAQGGVQAAADPNAYFVDTLFRPASGRRGRARPPRPTTSDNAEAACASPTSFHCRERGLHGLGPTSPPTRIGMRHAGERDVSARIFARSMGADMPAEDRGYHRSDRLRSARALTPGGRGSRASIR